MGHRASLDDFDSKINLLALLGYEPQFVYPVARSLHRQRSAACLWRALDSSDVGAILRGMTEKTLDFNDLA